MQFGSVVCQLDISRLERYSERFRSEVLLVRALVHEEEDEVIIFKVGVTTNLGCGGPCTLTWFEWGLSVSRDFPPHLFGPQQPTQENLFYRPRQQFSRLTESRVLTILPRFSTYRKD